MDVYDKDLIEFWSILEKEKVQYIMIGGLAVILHGYVRATGDIDIWLNDTKQNRTAFAKAMEHYNYNIKDIENFKFIPGWFDFYIGILFKLDVITEMIGLEDLSFEDCLNKASIANIKELKIPFLNLEHLIKNKEAINRLKDQLDISRLNEIKKLRQISEEE